MLSSPSSSPDHVQVRGNRSRRAVGSRLRLCPSSHLDLFVLVGAEVHVGVALWNKPRLWVWSVVASTV